MINKNLKMPLAIGFFLAAGLFYSCGNTEDRFGSVDMFHGRPKPPRMVLRSLLGPLPGGPFPSQKPGGILVMDTGADYNGEVSLTYAQNLLERYATKRRSGDIPFHFLIDGEGIVYAGRETSIPAELHEGDPFLFRPPMEKLSLMETRLAWLKNPAKNLDGYIVIAFLGDYDHLLVNKEQEKSFFQLCAYLTYTHNISLRRIAGLKQVYPESKNPGFYLNTYMNYNVLAKEIPPPPMQHRFLVTPDAK
ncbi:MAG: peptidoglycan recognition family protein [Candidatus Omnitrophota bacterium]